MGFIGRDWVNIIQGGEGKLASNDAGYLKRQLLLGRQSIDTTGDYRLDRVWYGNGTEIGHVGAELAMSSFPGDAPATILIRPVSRNA